MFIPAFAQSPPTSNGIEPSDIVTLANISIVGSAFVLSAIGWSILGWQKKRRTTKTPIDPRKLLKTILIGVIVGILAFVYSILAGDGALEYLHITSFEGYKQLLYWTFPVIVTIVVVLKKMFPDLAKLIDANDDDKEVAKLSNFKGITPIDDPDDLPPGKNNETQYEGKFTNS